MMLLRSNAARIGMAAQRVGAGVLAATLLAACGAREPGSVAPADLPDPTTLTRTGRPNDWLICPAGACAAKADAAPPLYPVRPGRLFAAWREVVGGQPRATVIGADEPRLLLLAQDRTPLLRFVDDVSVRVLPAPDGSSTFAAYSRSNIGRADLGTNRRRLEEWQAALDRVLARPNTPSAAP
jgi:uncharacterized protein (DUF1499 family)